jgi:Sulfatase
LKKFRSFLEGAGTAVLLLANYLWPLLSLFHLAIYHDASSASAAAAGLAIDLALTAMLVGEALILLDRVSSRRWGVVWAVLLAVWVTKTVDFTVFLLNYYRAELSWTTTMRVSLLCAALSAGVVLALFFPRALGKSVRVTRTGLAILGCCIIWMLPQLIFTAVRTHAPMANAFSRKVEQMASPQQRVVWILMDELSYDQVYEHRQPDVKLPVFDELKKNSVVFSDVQPEGYYTERIVPALFLGRRIDNIRSSLHRDLYIHDTEASRWEPFNQEASILGEAERSGWTTGVAGWYNPYCHILENVLDSCYWQAIGPVTPMLFGEQHAVLSAAAFPLDSLLAHFKAFTSPWNAKVVAHTQEYKDLMRAADAEIQDQSIDFVFLHLPVPHPPGIYDRKTGRLGVAGTYLDNLALADKTLGNLLEEIKGTAVANRTTVILSSDHSWRVDMWRVDAAWTAEEERASGGKFDPRPFLLIHFPGENAGEIRTESFPALGLHGILETMLRGEVDSETDLDRWLAGQKGASAQELLVTRSSTANRSSREIVP